MWCPRARGSEGRQRVGPGSRYDVIWEARERARVAPPLPHFSPHRNDNTGRKAEGLMAVISDRWRVAVVGASPCGAPSKQDSRGRRCAREQLLGRRRRT